MKLNITDTALTALQDKVSDYHIFALILDDGSNKYSDIGGTCSIGDSYQIVTLDQVDPDFNEQLSTNSNDQFYSTKNEFTFWGNGLTLDYTANNFVLSDDSGVLDGAVLLKIGTNQNPNVNVQNQSARK